MPVAAKVVDDKVKCTCGDGDAGADDKGEKVADEVVKKGIHGRA